MINETNVYNRANNLVLFHSSKLIKNVGFLPIA
jgi:hypothetical protein